MLDLLKRPTAFLPLAISAGFLIVLLLGLAQGTLARQPDEDVAAHLFQILIPVQIVFIGALGCRGFQSDLDLRYGFSACRARPY